MHNKDITVSVVTVTANNESTIARTMESILAQKYTNIEHIIVDGISTDRTLEIIDSYKPKYEKKGIVLKLISEPDKGPYDAMNKGVSIATGDIIGILNSDDCYDKDALSNVFDAVSNHNADIYMGAIRIHNGQNQIIEEHAKNTRYKTTRHYNHPAMFVKKDCYKTVGKYGLTNVHSDYGWYLKALKMGKKVYIIDHVLADFYTGGWSSKKSFSNTLARIPAKYQVYKENGYSKLYFFECFAQEIAKYILLKK